MSKIFNVMRRIDASWQGDLIGTVCVFVLAYGLWFIGCAVGL